MKQPKTAQLWDDIGFHRPLAGFWYRLLYEILIILIPVLLVTYLLKVLYPFPTSLGYATTFSGIFVLVFGSFDIGTANTINRFVAEVNIKDPSKVVQYVQYFIWYQSITGLIQITAISLWALYIVPNTEMAYGIWLILIIVIKQWPGFTGVFKAVLSSLQQYNKSTTIEFFQSEAIQRLTEIGFVLLGKWYGDTHPEIGMLMGIAMGSIFGLYFDDVIVAVISAIILTKYMKPFGINLKRLFTIEFDWKLVKQCLVFGLKTGLPGLIFASTQMISLMLCIEYIPQYTTFIVLKGMAVSLVAASERLVSQDFTPIFTEAYQNGKKELCQYYNAHALRFYMINTCFAFTIMLIVISLLPTIFLELKLNLYLLTIPFLIPSLLYRGSRVYVGYPQMLLVASHHPNLIFILKMCEEAGKILAWYLAIPVLNLYELGTPGIVYTLSLTELPASFLITVVSVVFIHKKVMKLKIMFWQTFVAPVISTMILYGIFWFLKVTVLYALFEWDFIGALIIAIVIVMILSLGLYFPLTVLMGGWDDNSIADFHLVAQMSGPSKILVKPMSFLIFKTVPISKLHNRFKYDETIAKKQIAELVELRNKQRVK